MQKYSKNISDQFEIKSVFDKKGTLRKSEDIDFVSQAQEEMDGSAEVNMEHLNLFGVELSSQEQQQIQDSMNTTSKDREHRRKFVADLLDILT